MNKEDIVKRCLDIMEDITKTTEAAVETMQNNAITVNILMEELMNGSSIKPGLSSGILSPGIFDNHIIKESKTDKLDEIVSEIADTIQSQNDQLYSDKPVFYSFDLPYDVDFEELTKKLKEKLSGDNISKKEEKEDLFNEEINFENPFE